jgi:uncharacterized cupin superfamily protein
MSDDNIWSDEWGEQGDDWSGGGGLAKALPRGEALGATVYELGRGNFGVYHFHHRSEELLILLAGRPTLRTPEGSRVLEPGDVVHFPVGPSGAHAVTNESEEPARFVMVSTRDAPEVVEYPDLGQITVQGRNGSQTGDKLWFIHNVESAD